MSWSNVVKRTKQPRKSSKKTLNPNHHGKSSNIYFKKSNMKRQFESVTPAEQQHRERIRAMILAEKQIDMLPATKKANSSKLKKKKSNKGKKKSIKLKKDLPLGEKYKIINDNLKATLSEEKYNKLIPNKVWRDDFVPIGLNKELHKIFLLFFFIERLYGSNSRKFNKIYEMLTDDEKKVYEIYKNGSEGDELIKKLQENKHVPLLELSGIQIRDPNEDPYQITAVAPSNFWWTINFIDEFGGKKAKSRQRVIDFVDNKIMEMDRNHGVAAIGAWLSLGEVKKEFIILQKKIAKEMGFN